TLINCVFSGNVAEGGGGGALVNAGPVEGWTMTLNVINCTMSQNKALAANAILNGGFLFVRNSIVWGNFKLASEPEFFPIFTGGVGATATVTYSDVEGGGFGGPPNLNVNPVFIDADGADGIAGTLDDNLRVACTSPVVDVADTTVVPIDAFDVDNDGDTETEKAPDRDRLARVIDSVVDMGAHEQRSALCPGDVYVDGVVNISDLLAVITGWGTAGPSDIAPPPCGNGTTNIDDLLAVIQGWGACPLMSTCPGCTALPETYADCDELCDTQYPPEFYNDCMYRCLCSIGVIECE
ncbi:MAG: hypothetical protein L0219_01900, partial [Phycisphaerales bacterium]|nr:hypothetical protein [Phycisphaerales bacterium]